MKTAVSIPDNVFKEVERIAREYNRSRSEVVVIALKEFLEKLKSKKLLDALNKVYSDTEESSEEKTLRDRSKRYYAKKILKEKY